MQVETSELAGEQLRPRGDRTPQPSRRALVDSGPHRSRLSQTAFGIVATLVSTACADIAPDTHETPQVQVRALDLGGSPHAPNVGVSFDCDKEELLDDGRRRCTMTSVEPIVVASPEHATIPFEARNVLDQRNNAASHARETSAALAEGAARCEVSPDGWSVDQDGWPLDDITLTVELVEQPFDFFRFRTARAEKNREAFNALIAEREAQIMPFQRDFEADVIELGGRVVMNLRLANVVQVVVPVCQVATIASLPDVVAVEFVDDDDIRILGVEGDERREVMGIPAGTFLDLDGGEGSWNSGTARVRYGVIDGTNLNTSHRTFFDDSGTNDRIVDTDRCDNHPPFFVMRCVNSATTTANTHGTRVTHLLLGDATDGQDSSLTTPLNRQRHSGIAREAEVHYYKALSLAGVAKGIDEAAMDNDIDIINLSVAPSISSAACTTSSHSGVRGAIEAATDAGVLVVVAAGNEGDDATVGGTSCFSAGSPPSGWDPQCTVTSFGFYPDSMTVGSTQDVGLMSSLDSVNPHRCSSSGAMSVTLSGGSGALAIPVDVVTNDGHALIAGAGTAGYGPGAGTSLAAPVIAGVVGLLADWVHDRGGFGSLAGDPYFMRTFISWMADGRGDYDGVDIEWNNTIDRHFGFGNVRFADVDNLGTGSGFGLKRLTLAQGSSFAWWVGSSSPRSTAIKGWKLAALVDLNAYDGAPKLRIELIDVCPPGGGAPVVLKTANRNALKYRLRLHESEMATKFWGRCVQVKVTVEHASTSFLFYAADGFYTGARVNHESSIF